MADYVNKISFNNCNEDSIYLYINESRVNFKENIVGIGNNENKVSISFGIDGIDIINDGTLGDVKFKYDILDEYGKSLILDFSREENTANEDLKFSSELLFNGKYDIKVTFYEDIKAEGVPANEISKTYKNIMIQGCFTQLVYFNPKIDIQYGYDTNNVTDHVELDANKSSDIYYYNSSNKRLNIVLIKLTEETPIDIAISSIMVTRNGLNISYKIDGDQDQLAMKGDYVVTVTLRRRGTELNGDIMVKNIIGKFSIKDSVDSDIINEADDIYIYNSNNMTCILNRVEYYDNALNMIDWTLSEGVEVLDYSLYLYSNAKVDYINESNDDLQTYYKENYPPVLLGDFEPGGTILSKNGVYKLSLTVSKYGGPKTIITRMFAVRKINTLSNIDESVILDNIVIYYVLNESVFEMPAHKEFLSNEKVIPYICFNIMTNEYVTVMDIEIEYSVTGKIIKFINGETTLTDPGNYIVKSVTIYDPDVPDYKIVKTNNLATFTIVPTPMDLNNVKLVLNRITTNENGKEMLEEINNGAIFEERKYSADRVPGPVIDYYFEYPNIDGLEVRIFEEGTSSTIEKVEGDNTMEINGMKRKRCIHMVGSGTYTIKLKLKDKTINPEDPKTYLYPNNYIEKIYNLRILDIKPAPENSTEIQVYINGLLFDPHNYTGLDKRGWWDEDSNDPIIIGASEGVPPSESQFRIVKPGTYNILLVNKNKFNFNYSINEYNLTVIDKKNFKQPIITRSCEETDKDYYMMITFPATAAKGYCQYWDKHAYPEENWITYEPGSKLYYSGVDCELYARYKDSATGEYTTPDPEGVHGPKITNIIIPPKVIGIENGKRYSSAAVYVERELQHEYMMWIDNGPGTSVIKDEYKDSTGNGVPIEFGVLRTHNGGTSLPEGKYKITVRSRRTNIEMVEGETNTYNQLAPITITIDHSTPKDKGKLPTLSATIPNNGSGKGPVTLTLTGRDNNNFWYEIYANNRCIYNSKKFTINSDIPKISIPGVYSIVVVTIDRETEQRSVITYSFTINNSSITLSNTLKLQPLKCYFNSDTGTYSFYNNSLPYDGELLIMCNSSFVPNGEIGIYRDGLVLNKLIDLGESVQCLEDSLLNASDGNSVELDVIMNRTISDSLSSLKKELYYSLSRLMIDNAALSQVVNNMYEFCVNAELPELEEAVMKRLETNESFIKSRKNSAELTNLNNKKYLKAVNKMYTIINSLQDNAKMIGEIEYLSNLYRLRYKK